MRLILLVDLGSDESGKVSYGLIRYTLQINDDEVEPWVVKAITAKLLDYKMDQMSEVVIVTRSTQRVFGHHQKTHPQHCQHIMAESSHSRTVRHYAELHYQICGELFVRYELKGHGWPGFGGSLGLEFMHHGSKLMTSYVVLEQLKECLRL